MEEYICSKAGECDRKNNKHCKPHKHVIGCDDGTCRALPAPCIPIEAEVPPADIKVGRRYRIERKAKGDQFYLINGVYMISEAPSEASMGDVLIFATKEDGVRRAAECYKFYEVNETETSEKEQNMGQTLYTTAVAELRENDDGTFAIDSVNNEQTKDAESLNQAMISRHTTSVLSATKKEQIADIVGKEPDGTWKRMDQI